MDGLTLEKLRRMLRADRLVACNMDGAEIGRAEKGDVMYKMSDEEVNQYIQGLLSHPKEDLTVEDLELEVVGMLRDLNQEVTQVQVSLQKRAQEVNTLKEHLQGLNGKLAACAQILVRAEESRIVTKRMKEDESDTEEGQSGTRSEEASDGPEDARVVPLSG